MKIVNLDLFRYQLPLKQKLTIGGIPIPVREGIVLRLNDSDGSTGYGEVAPLPGVHKETTEEAIQLLQEQKNRIINLEFEQVFEFCESMGESYLPSVKFGIESAFLSLFANRDNTRPAALLNDQSLKSITVNALFSGSAHAAERAVKEGLFRNYSTLKIKVGHGTLEEEVKILEILRSGLGESTRFRLDANRAFDLRSSIRFIQSLSQFPIEYMEEPLKDPFKIPELTVSSKIPIALDESLWDKRYSSLWTDPAVKFHIIKPSRFGSLFDIMDHKNNMEKHGIQCVISSAFESGLGCAMLAQTASAVQTEDTAAGLGTDQWLVEDIIQPAFDSSSGCIPTEHFQFDVLEERLTRI